MAAKKTSKKPILKTAGAAAPPTAGAAPPASTKRRRLIPLIRTKSGKPITEVLSHAQSSLQSPTPPPKAVNGLDLKVRITQEDIDAQLLFSMLDSNTGMLSSLHALALEGKRWLQAEPDKANLFLATAKKTTTYRPLKLLFDMMELDDEILKAKPPTDQGKKNAQAAFNSLAAFAAPIDSIMRALQQAGINVNTSI